MVVIDFVKKTNKQTKPVTVGLDNTAKAVDHVKIESMYSVSQKWCMWKCATLINKCFSFHRILYDLQDY